MNKRIPLSQPVMAGNEWKYVKECIDTAWVSSAGKFVETFAERFAQYVDAPYAVPTSSGTAALHLALIALGLQPDEEVLVPAMTFVATANPVIYCGATPVFMDIEAQTLGMDGQKVADFLAHECAWRDGKLWNRTTGRRVRGMIPVHLYGHPVDMEPLLELAEKYHLFVLEDATESLGSKYQGQATGTLGTIGAFSFNGNKLITTGGGGMVVTRDESLADHIRFLTTQAKSPGREYYHTEVGYNYRLTNLQAALGLAQLERIDAFIARRRAIAQFYRRELAEVPGVTVWQDAEWAFNNSWLSWMLLGPEYGQNRDELLDALNAQNIEARPLFLPLHSQPPYQKYPSYAITQAPKLHQRGLNLPSHTTLGEEDLARVVGVIRELQR